MKGNRETKEFGQTPSEELPHTDKGRQRKRARTIQGNIW